MRRRRVARENHHEVLERPGLEVALDVQQRLPIALVVTGLEWMEQARVLRKPAGADLAELVPRVTAAGEPLRFRGIWLVMQRHLSKIEPPAAGAPGPAPRPAAGPVNASGW